MVGLFRILTQAGLVLRHDVNTGQIVAGPPSPDHRDVLLYLPHSSARIGVLVSATGTFPPLFVAGDTTPHPLLPVRYQDGAAEGSIALCHPFSGLCLSLPPVAAADGMAETTAPSFSQSGSTEQDLFRLEELNLLPDMPALLPMLEAVQHYAALPADGPAWLEILRAGIGVDRALAFDTVARFLPRAEIDWMARRIMDDPALRRALQRAFPTDLFACHALPELATWLEARPPLTRAEIPAAYDRLATAGLDGACTSFAHLCGAAARRIVRPRRDIAIVATARNEGLYLLEWIAYHRAIGVGDIVLYSNNNDDGSDRLLAALSEAGLIGWIRSELRQGHAAQPKAYGHAFGVLPQILDNRWTLVIDLDEFFAFDTRRFASIGDFVAWQEARPVDAIALNWLVFGSSGTVSRTDEMLIQRITHRLPWQDPHIKTMVRSHLPIHAHPHHPAFDPRDPVVTRAASGGLHRSRDGASFSDAPETDLAWINHYFLKSAEEFVWKFSRNRGDHQMRQDMDPMRIDPEFVSMFLKQHGSDTMVQDTRIQARMPDMAREIERLHAAPGVTAAMNDVRLRYRMLSEQLRARMHRGAADLPPDTPQRRLADLFGAA
jgi:Glycosyl transferase family 2